jgi:hypothetical protein
VNRSESFKSARGLTDDAEQVWERKGEGDKSDLKLFPLCAVPLARGMGKPYKFRCTYFRYGDKSHLVSI